MDVFPCLHYFGLEHASKAPTGSFASNLPDKYIYDQSKRQFMPQSAIGT